MPPSLPLRALVLVALVCSVLCGGTGRDFYKILGVPRNADDAAIKRAYRKGALKWHPDKVEEGEREVASSRFAEIANAYETLSDPEKRRVYDQVGEQGGAPQGGGGGGGGGGRGGAGHSAHGGGATHHFSHHFSSSTDGGGAGFTDPQTLFNMFFGGGGGGGGAQAGGAQQQQPQQPPRPDLFSTAPDVVKLDTKNFKSIAGRDHRGHKVVVLEFYSPSCGHCKAAAGELSKVATALKGVVTVAVVDCGAQAAICEAYAVDHYPTIMILHPGGSTDYTGRVTAKAVRDAAVERIPRRAATIAAEGGESRLALDKLARRCALSSAAASLPRPSGGCVALVSHSSTDEVPPLFAALAADPAFDHGANGTTPGFHFFVMRARGGGGGEKHKLADGAGRDLGVSTTPGMVFMVGGSLSDFSSTLVAGNVGLHAQGGFSGRAVFTGRIEYDSARKWLLEQQKMVKQHMGKRKPAPPPPVHHSTSGGGGGGSPDVSVQAPAPAEATLQDLIRCFGLSVSSTLEQHPELVDAAATASGMPRPIVAAALRRVMASAGVPDTPTSDETTVCLFVLPQAARTSAQREALRSAAGHVASKFHAVPSVTVLLTPLFERGGAQQQHGAGNGAGQQTLAATVKAALVRAVTSMIATSMAPGAPVDSTGLAARLVHVLARSLHRPGAVESMPEALVVLRRKSSALGALVRLDSDARASLDSLTDSSPPGAGAHTAHAVARGWVTAVSECLTGELPLQDLPGLALEVVRAFADAVSREGATGGAAGSRPPVGRRPGVHEL